MARSNGSLSEMFTSFSPVAIACGGIICSGLLGFGAYKYQMHSLSDVPDRVVRLESHVANMLDLPNRVTVVEQRLVNETTTRATSDDQTAKRLESVEVDRRHEEATQHAIEAAVSAMSAQVSALRDQFSEDRKVTRDALADLRNDIGRRIESMDNLLRQLATRRGTDLSVPTDTRPTSTAQMWKPP